MDEVEACVFLSREHANSITGNTSDHVLVVGGSRGVLRFYTVSYSYSGGKKDSHSFSCSPLLVLPISGEESNYRTMIPRGNSSDDNNMSIVTSKKSSDDEEAHGIISMIYLPQRKHSQLVAVTSDQTFCCYEFQTETKTKKTNDFDDDNDISTSSASSSSKKKSKSTKSMKNEQDQNQTSTSVVLSRQLIGTHDDILDICCIPTYKNGKKDYNLAVASNSPHIRITNMLTNTININQQDENVTSTFSEESSSILLYGHTDIVLALDASPDG
mgnify:CR=1 FL=1